MKHTLGDHTSVSAAASLEMLQTVGIRSRFVVSSGFFGRTL